MSTDELVSLGPLLARVPDAVRGVAAYHVAKSPVLRVKLDANELPFALPADLRSRLAAALAEVPLERYPDPQATELRGVVAEQLGLSGDQLTFGNGSDELIAMIMAVFAAPRGSAPAAVLYPTPTFVYFRLAAIARGVEPIEVALDPAFQLDEPAVIRAIETHKPSVVFLALPNNPTGTLWRMDFAIELATRFRDIAIISDEAYFAYSGQTSLPRLSAHPNLIIMRTLSKVGMAGLRVGFTIASPAIAALLERVRPPYNLSSLDQCAAIFMLREASAWCADSAALVIAERTHLAAMLAKLPRVEVFPSEANLLLVRLGAGRATTIYQQLAAAGILVRNFDRKGPLEGCLRITVGTPAENAALVAAMSEHCA